ncbi:cytochrome d ubiquinol oxidase subunit II [Compostibacter hankyongensis]|uniref:Cytochrome d ubiquinol oxidase subunit II n=1 Tax=Compostibacter hankyongensis TaxID=1007089 RepID=A0ABP8FK74_9BACT
MHLVVVIFLCLSILLYLLLGGADFGAGIIELFTSYKNKPRTRRITYRAIGPVWEANHMWLIIAIVILFVGFPLIYTTMSIYLHIPMLIMLLGIVARGTAFIFRHYDAVRDNFQKLYNKIFVYSSFITPLLLGMIAGTMLSGKIDPEARSFYDIYMAPWCNLFSLAVGLFTVALCGFLAAVYLIGEAQDDYDKRRFIHKAGITNLLAVLAGGLVFLAAETEHIPLWRWLFGDPVSRYAILAASASLVLLWYYLFQGRKLRLRVLAGFQVTMILLAIAHHNFPDFLILQDGTRLSLWEDAAPVSTLRALGWALLSGSVFILPFLGYLFYNFTRAETAEAEQPE